MHDIVLSLVQWFHQFSYLGVVLALTIEFVPAELVLPLVGYWVSQGEMNMLGAILAGTLGGTCGPLTLYALGKYGGRPFLAKYGKYFFMKEQHLEKSDYFFEKHGGIVAFTGRFVPGVRTLISIPCGLAKMNVWVFSLYTFIAMLPITSFYIYLGYKFGSNWEKVGPYASQYMTPIGLGVLLVIIIMVFIKYKKRNK